MRRILIYSSVICPYCISAKKLLEKLDLSFQESLDQKQEQKLCEQIDIELVDSAELSHDNFSITVSQVKSVNLYGKEED